MKQTAVEWLFKQISTSKHFYNLMEDINSRSTVAQSNILEQAKEMEIKQTHEYAEFAIRCDRKDMKILNFDGYINLENTEQ